jgi:transposase
MTQKAAERETYDDPDNEKQKTEQSHLQAMTHERKIGAVRQYVHNRQTRHVIVSEIGIDMSRFPSAAHLISWACICPRNDESAGKRRSNRVRKGGTWLKTTLVQCALAAVKKKDSYLQAQFYRIKARRGPKKAIMAVVASILTAIYHMLKDWTMYNDLGRNHFDRRSSDQQKNRLVKRLIDLGYAVEIKPHAAAA